MISIASLWIPIVGSALAVWVASSVIHMVLKYHQGDWSGLPDEDGVMDALRGYNIAPGDYMMPHCASSSAWKDETFLAKFERGPVALLTVWKPGPPAMGAQMVQWISYCIVVSVLAAYIATRTLDPGTEYLKVFQITATVAFMGYGLGSIPEAIWYKRQWATQLRFLFDGLVYGLITGGFFGWLWPAAV